jgi:hypothetical protein
VKSWIAHATPALIRSLLSPKSGTCESGRATMQPDLNDGASGASPGAQKVTGDHHDFVQDLCRFGGVVGDGGYARVLENIAGSTS